MKQIIATAKGLVQTEKPVRIQSASSEKALNKKAGRDIMAEWKLMLRSASDYYNISADPNDYIVVPVAIVPTELPNVNGFAMTLDQLTKWVPHRKQLSYQTWIGCPTHIDHEADNPREAKGMVIDSVLKPSPFDSIWYMTQLLAYDKTKDKALAEQIMDDDRNSYSMGCTAGSYICSITGKDITESKYFPTNNPNQPMYLTTGSSGERAGMLVYAKGINIEGAETSNVGSPAWRTAITPNTHVKSL